MEVRHLYFDADLWNVTGVEIHSAVKDVEEQVEHTVAEGG